MKTITVNNELSLSCPDGFRELSAEESKRYYTKTGNRCVLHNAEAHILFSVAWTNAGLLSFLTDAKSVLKGCERNLRTLNCYQDKGISPVTVASVKGQALRYGYQAKDADIMQDGELIAVRYKKKFYLFESNCRRQNSEEARALIGQILSSITLL